MEPRRVTWSSFFKFFWPFVVLWRRGLKAGAVRGHVMAAHHSEWTRRILRRPTLRRRSIWDGSSSGTQAQIGRFKCSAGFGTDTVAKSATSQAQLPHSPLPVPLSAISFTFFFVFLFLLNSKLLIFHHN